MPNMHIIGKVAFIFFLTARYVSGAHRFRHFSRTLSQNDSDDQNQTVPAEEVELTPSITGRFKGGPFQTAKVTFRSPNVLVRPGTTFDHTDVTSCYDFREKYTGVLITQPVNYANTHGTCILMYSRHGCEGYIGTLTGVSNELRRLASFSPCLLPPPTPAPPPSPPPTPAPTPPPPTPPSPPPTINDTTGLLPPTSPPNPNVTKPVDGAPCNSSNCEIQMTCKTYSFCQRLDTSGNPDNTSGIVTTIVCKTNYFSVPINISGVSAGQVVAASCRQWMDLDELRKNEILQDKDCTYCNLIATGGSCSSEFKFRNDMGELSETQNCPHNMVIDTDNRSCVNPCKASGELLIACKNSGKCP